MPDITMCSNKDCPLRERCYRAQAEPSYWQSYAMFQPEGDSCEHFRRITRAAAEIGKMNLGWSEEK